MISQAERVLSEAQRDAALGRKRCLNEPSSGQRADMERLLKPTGHILVGRSDRSDFLLYKLQTAAKEAKFEDKDETVLLTTVTAQIVGLDYHLGKTGAGDTVVVAHERENKYDANAVSIHSFHGHSDRTCDDDNRVGYLPREQAAAISGLMSIPFGNLEEDRTFDVSGVVVGGVPKAKAYFSDDVDDDYEATYDEHGEEELKNVFIPLAIEICGPASVKVAIALQHYLESFPDSYKLRVNPWFLEKRVKDAKKRLEFDPETEHNKRKRSN